MRASEAGSGTTCGWIDGCLEQSCDSATVISREVVVFRVGDALRAGASRRSVDSDALDRPFTGLRATRTQVASPSVDPAEVEKASHAESARQFTAHMHRQEFFSHVTAAVLWDLPLPRLDLARIDVAVLAPHRAPRGRGVRGHQLSPRQVTTTVAGGMRLTSPAATWAQLGGLARHPYDLTAIADAILLTPRVPGPRGRVIRQPLATLQELQEELRRGRRIGIGLLEEALRRARPGAVSRPETWTRLTLIDAGLPEPVLDHDVYDGDVFVGCVDLAYPELRIAIEYEGDHHRLDAAQWNRDIEKHDRLAALGWRVIRVTKAMLFQHPGELTARVRAALRARR